MHLTDLEEKEDEITNFETKGCGNYESLVD